MNKLENVASDADFWDELEVLDSKRNPRHRVFSEADQELVRLFNSSPIEKAKEGSIFEADYIGLVDNYHQFRYKGLKDDIYVENRPSENKFLKNTEVGDKLEVVITQINEDYFLKGSVSQLYQSQAHDELLNLDDLVVEIDIKGINPAGYDVDIIHNSVTLPGFMPNTLAGINKLYDPESIIGEKMYVMVENYSKFEGTYIVSRRKYLKTLIPEALDELIVGEVYSGHVTGTTPFGVFVEFNDCLTGMIHKANIVEEYRDRIQDIPAGTEIEFYVKEIIRKKIILTQVWRDSLWDNISIGQTIKGTVKDNKSFGTLISLDAETMGLIHTSELDKTTRKLSKGEDVNVKVLAVDRQNRKIFLTLD